MSAAAPTAPAWLGPAGRGERQTRATTTLVLGVAAIAVWWPVLGSGALWATPILLVSTLIAGRLIVPRSRIGLLATSWSWLLWAVLAIPLAGAPIDAALPTGWPSAVHELSNGLRDVATGNPGPWPLAAWLGMCGAFWMSGATQSIRAGRGAAALAFLSLAAPLVLAMVFSRVPDAGWHGAVVLGAALLWATRGGLRAALPAALVVGTIATVASVLIGPTERKISAIQNRGKVASLDSRQTYSANAGGHTGATMFEVQSPQAALWRMQVLSLWDGRGWSLADREVARPQPLATRLSSTVTIKDLEDVRVVAAGRVVGVSGGATTSTAQGESLVFPSPATRGSSYTVTADLLQPAAEDLRQIKIPSAAAFPDETRLWPGVDPVATAPQANHPEALFPEQRAIGWDRVYALARRLRSPGGSELESVERVQSYLQDPSNFRYSTSVPAPDGQPLVQFLLSTHVGYCQHFAGAAALLLRLQGVPTRVVTGFGTGESIGSGRYRVTDNDAHAWIEVYFPRVGWVPFNPTPAAAAAHIGRGVDPLAGATAGSGSVDRGARQAALIVLGLLGAVGLVFAVRRARRAQPPLLSDLLVRQASGAPGPAATLGAVRQELAAMGPRVAALVDEAERARFQPGAQQPASSRTRLRLWRALAHDLGLLRGTARLWFGAPSERNDGLPVRPVAHASAAAGAEALAGGASVAPPGGPR